MARQKLKAKDKKTQKITRNGLVEKNQETGKQTNISNKISDFSFDKKQNKGQNIQKTKEKNQGGRTARLASFKKKQQRKQIQKAQLENEMKNDIPLYEQHFSELENNDSLYMSLSNEEKQQEQQYQPAKSNVKSDFKKRIVKKTIAKNKKDVKLQGISETKNILQYKNSSDKKIEKNSSRQIKQKLHDVSIKESETSENKNFHTEKKSFEKSKEKKTAMKKQQQKVQQRKSAERIKKNDFSLQQAKQENSYSEFQTVKKEQNKNHLEFEHKKQKQKTQKQKLQTQRNTKIQFSTKEQQNLNEVSENDFSKNKKIQYQSFYKNSNEEQKAKKLQYYANEKQEQNQYTNEKQQKKQNEKQISLNKETKKEISTNDKLKLEKLENKVQKAQQKLEKAEQKLPKKTKIKFEKSFDETTKKSKVKFHIEKEVKPQYEVKPIRTIVKKSAVTPPRLLWHKGHQKIAETEKENTAVEAVHKNEQRAELLLTNGYRRWSNSRKNKPYHTVTKMEKRLQKANTKYHITKFSVENEKAKPEKINKKWLQKQNIKKKYAQMIRQKQNTETIRTAKDVFIQIVRAIFQVASTHKAVCKIKLEK